MNEYGKILDFLDSGLTEPVRDPVWKHIYLAPEHEKIISLPVFQELHDIKQLGPAYLVYPGATHTRFAHSLGTFHIARRLIGFLVRRKGASVFTAEGVRTFLCAALLHDLGHFPFAHALKNLGLKDHESLTAGLVRETPLSSLLRRDAGVDPERVGAVVDTSLPADDDRELAILRRLLSGVLDPDKLDYLNRDAYYCGVPYGIQDVDFFLGEVVPDEGAGFGITPKGLTAVEHILISKYLMYKTVYWHKTVRAATAMIKKALHLALRDGALAPDQLYRKTDSTLIRLAYDSSYPAFALIREVCDRRLYKRVLSVPYREENEGHRSLADREGSLRREQEIAEELSQAVGRKVDESEIIIDVPEPLSFEIDLTVAAEGGSSSECGYTRTIWSGRSRESFGESLRTVSLLVRRDERLLEAAEAFVRIRDPFTAHR